MSEKTQTNSSISIGSFIFLIFLTLKLGGWGTVATWSWWWVTAPLWIPVVALIIAAIIYVIVQYIKDNL